MENNVLQYKRQDPLAFLIPNGFETAFVRTARGQIMHRNKNATVYILTVK